MSTNHKHQHEEYILHECDGDGHEHHHHADGSCCCEHHAEEFHGIEKPMLFRLIAAAVLYVICQVIPVSETTEAVLMIVSALLSGYDIILDAFKKLIKMHLFDEYFLMSFAAVAACLIGEFEECAAVFLLYRIGSFCQSYAIRHSKKNIANLTGECMYEPQPSEAKNAFITKFAQVYTPIVIGFAVLLVIFIPIFTSASFRDAIYRGLTFLVVACPCAIVISVPLTYFSGIAASSKKGIFFRDAAALDEIAKQKPEHLNLKNVSIKYKTAYIYTLSDQTDVKTAELVMTGEADTAKAIHIAKQTRRIAHENVLGTILIKIIVLILGACGVSALWFAVFADSGVTVLAVLNSLRAFRIKK